MVMRIQRTRYAELQKEIDAITDIEEREKRQSMLDACFGVEVHVLGDKIPSEIGDWYNGKLTDKDIEELSVKLKPSGINFVSCVGIYDKIDAIVDAVYKNNKNEKENI